jgi:cell division protein FtsL
MNFNIDASQERKLRVLFGAVAFLGGVTAILIYFHQKKALRQQQELMDLEMKVKMLELKELQKKR